MIFLGRTDQLTLWNSWSLHCLARPSSSAVFYLTVTASQTSPLLAMAKPIPWELISFLVLTNIKFAWLLAAWMERPLQWGPIRATSHDPKLRAVGLFVARAEFRFLAWRVCDEHTKGRTASEPRETRPLSKTKLPSRFYPLFSWSLLSPARGVFQEQKQTTRTRSWSTRRGRHEHVLFLLRLVSIWSLRSLPKNARFISVISTIGASTRKRTRKITCAD